MSKSFQPDSIHPYIMDARLKKATGSGGIVNIPIASSDTVGGIMIGGSANPITITGSGNASVRKATSELLGVVKAGDGVTVDADGAISGVAYSTTEHKTGRKWIDGEDIYEKVFEYEGALGDTAATLASDIDYMSNIVNAICISDGVENSYACSFSPITVWIDSTNNLKGRSLGNFTSQLLHIVIEYTKEATEE